MEQVARVGEAFAGLRAVLPISLPEAQGDSFLTERYKDLLYKISGHFGFTGTDVEALLHKTYTYASAHPDKQDTLTQRVWLAKILVYQCVFLISSELFRQSGCYAEKNRSSSLTYYYRYRNASELHVHQMPLSFRAVYILGHCIGFTEPEIAAILNTTLLKVKERHAKALAFLMAHS